MHIYRTHEYCGFFKRYSTKSNKEGSELVKRILASHLTSSLEHSSRETTIKMHTIYFKIFKNSNPIDSHLMTVL